MFAVALVVVACGPSSPQETGVVLSVDSPALGQVDRDLARGCRVGIPVGGFLGPE